jgi:hypothetical protein
MRRKLLSLLLLMIAATGCGEKAKQDAATPDAATLDRLLQHGRIDHFECSGGYPGATNAFYAEVVPEYFRLFDATNRVQVSSTAFYSNSPGRIVFFSGTNAILALGYGNNVFAFRDYYFRLSFPTNVRDFFLPL